MKIFNRSSLAAFALISMVLSTPTIADEWGCQVLLCTSNPGGWQTIPDCIEPMTRLEACRAVWFSPCAYPICAEAVTPNPLIGLPSTDPKPDNVL